MTGTTESREYHFCPLMPKDIEGCYSKELNSQSIEKMVYYCKANFNECDIYKKKQGDKVMGKTILIADDSPSMRQLVAFALEDAGYEVTAASDGKDALERLKGQEIAMVITDLNMPEMNGIELIKRLRNGAGFGLKPILMLTTESHEDMKQEGKNAGATGWITKPFKPEQLLEVVRKLIR